ncbi:MAG: HNH endonuclease signature motif containing protein, partial [Acidimicrobiales bacterium]
EALVDVCRHFLDHQRSQVGGRHRPHLNVVVDLEALEEGRGGRVVDGPALDGATLSRMVCDCALHRVVMSGRSAVLDYGTSTRTIPAPLWSALVIRDEHCRFPCCDRPSRWCEGHHVIWVTAGGPTELANLVLVCSRHHHRLHQPRWQAKLLPDATFEVTAPDGIVRATSPPGAEVPW